MNTGGVPAGCGAQGGVSERETGRVSVSLTGEAEPAGRVCACFRFLGLPASTTGKSLM